MSARYGFKISMAPLLFTMLGSVPAGAQWGGGSNDADTQYIMDSKGNYTGTKNKITGSNTNGHRYACTPATGGYSCRPCGECHTPAQAQDAKYVASFDGKRHETTHFPKFIAALTSTQKYQMGLYATASYRNSAVVVSSRDKIPKDLVVFPIGSKIYLNPTGLVSFIVLPPTGEPKVPSR